jgi:hypothetical protein
MGSPPVLAEGEPCFVHLARLLPRGTRPRRALRSVRAPPADPSSRTARRRSCDVTPLTGRPVTLANGDWADLATGVTAYTRPSWRRIWTSPSREASSSTSARRWRAVEYVYNFIDPAPLRTSLVSSRSSGSARPARARETQMTEHLPECTHRTRRCPTRDRDPRHVADQRTNAR